VTAVTGAGVWCILLGWLNMLRDSRSFLRRRRRIQQPISAASSRKAPTTEPTTMPAIAPPLSPVSLVPALVLFAVALGLLEDVELGNSGGMEDVVGKRTFVHRVSARALVQHESVELGELFAQ
jgi:hypothetical protein